jgi:hypothetical protein
MSKTRQRHFIIYLCWLALFLWVGSANAAISLTVSPSTVPANTTSGFTFQTQAHEAGGVVTFQFYTDFNGNHVIDGEEWPFLTQTIGDNDNVTAAGNALAPDSDPASPAITTVFNPFASFGGYLPAANGIVKVINSLGESATVPFSITPVAAPQSISGTVYIQGTSTPVPYALIICEYAPVEDTIGVSFSDANGAYTLQLPSLSGDFEVAAQIPGLIGSYSQITLAAGSHQTLNLYVLQTDAVITGSVTEYGSGTPLPNVPVYAETMDGKETETVADSNGQYSLPVIAGIAWDVNSEDQLPGYFAMRTDTNYTDDHTVITPTVAGPNVVNFIAHKETAWLEGTVLDEYGNYPVQGALLFANRMNTSDPVLQGLSNGHYSNDSGQVTVGVENGDWSVGLCMNCHDQPVYIQGVQREVVPPPNVDITNLAVNEHRQVTMRAYYADGAIQGQVFQQDCTTPAPAGVRVGAWSNSSPLNGTSQTPINGNISTQTETDENGNYRLPLLGGNWSVQAQMDDWNKQSNTEVVNLNTDGDDVIEEGAGEVISNVNLCLNMSMSQGPTFDLAMVFSDASRYDPASFPFSQGDPYYNGATYWQMTGTAEVSGNPTNPVYLNSQPTGNYELIYEGMTGPFYNFSLGIFSDYNNPTFGGPFAAPGATWEDQHYTFSVDSTQQDWYIPSGSLQQLAVPQVTVTGDLYPEISWSSVAGADNYQVWIYSLDQNGYPYEWLFDSGPINQTSYTYNGNIFENGGSYAIRVLAIQLHPYSATDPAYQDRIINMSSFYTKHTASNTVSGQVTSSVLGYSAPVAGAEVKLEGGGQVYTANTDANGNFVLAGIPADTYTLTISAANLSPIVQENVEVVAGQNLVLDSLPEMLVSSTSTVIWDVNGDGKLDLSDIIFGLQVLSGMR